METRPEMAILGSRKLEWLYRTRLTFKCRQACCFCSGCDVASRLRSADLHDNLRKKRFGDLLTPQPALDLRFTSFDKLYLNLFSGVKN